MTDSGDAGAPEALPEAKQDGLGGADDHLGQQRVVMRTPDIELTGTLPDGKRVHVVALLVDNVREGGPVFEERYEALSSRADFIV